eukprot:6056342-Pleurochrysis_carterae.AAC.1
MVERGGEELVVVGPERRDCLRVGDDGLQHAPAREEVAEGDPVAVGDGDDAAAAQKRDVLDRVGVSERQHAAVGDHVRRGLGHAHRAHEVCVALELAQLRLRTHVPPDDQLVVSAREEAGAVGGEGERVRRLGVAAEGAHDGARGQIEEHRCALCVGGREHLAVGAVARRSHNVLEACQRAEGRRRHAQPAQREEVHLTRTRTSTNRRTGSH